MTKHCNDAKMKAQAALEAAQAALVDLRNKEVEASAVLAAAEKQKAYAEKRRADVVLFEIAGTNGLVCRCHIPTAAVAQHGLFCILLGSSGAPSGIEDIQQKYGQTAAALYAKAAGQNAQARQLYNATSDTYYKANDAAAYDDWVRARNHWDYFYNRS